MDSAEKPYTDRLLKPGEVASLFGVTPKCVTDWVKAGKITAQRTFGGHRRYRESEIRAALDELKAAA